MEWLLSQKSGQAGIDWFLGLDDAFASLKSFRSDVQSLRKPTAFPLRCGNSFTDGSRTFIEFSSPSPPMSSPYCTFGTEDADLRSSNESCRRVHGRLDVRGSPCFQQDRVFEHYGAYRRTTSQFPESDRDRKPLACAGGSSPIKRRSAYLPTWILAPVPPPRPGRAPPPSETSFTQSVPSPR